MILFCILLTSISSTDMLIDLVPPIKACNTLIIQLPLKFSSTKSSNSMTSLLFDLLFPLLIKHDGLPLFFNYIFPNTVLPYLFSLTSLKSCVRYFSIRDICVAIVEFILLKNE